MTALLSVLIAAVTPGVLFVKREVEVDADKELRGAAGVGETLGGPV